MLTCVRMDGFLTPLSTDALMLRLKLPVCPFTMAVLSWKYKKSQINRLLCTCVLIVGRLVEQSLVLQVYFYNCVLNSDELVIQIEHYTKCKRFFLWARSVQLGQVVRFMLVFHQTTCNCILTLINVKVRQTSKLHYHHCTIHFY